MRRVTAPFAEGHVDEPVLHVELRADVLGLGRRNARERISSRDNCASEGRDNEQAGPKESHKHAFRVKLKPSEQIVSEIDPDSKRDCQRSNDRVAYSDTI